VHVQAVWHMTLLDVCMLMQSVCMLMQSGRLASRENLCLLFYARWGKFWFSLC